MNTRYRRRPLAAATAAFLLALSVPVAAQSVWTGAVDDDWFNAGNWQDGVVPPNGAQYVQIDINAPAPVIDSGAATVNGALRIASGSGQMGGLAVRNAGTLSTAGAELAGGEGAHAMVNVEGAGSVWTNTEALTVGVLGDAELAVLGGGKVSATNILIASLGGSSVVNVIGPGSTLESGLGVSVGAYGLGALNIDGGAVVTGKYGSVGYVNGSAGAVHVNGSGSLWKSTGTSGGFSLLNGTVSVTSGGKIDNEEDSTIGSYAADSAYLSVDGLGSVFSTKRYLYIGSGEGGEARMSVTNLGKVEMGMLRIGGWAGRAGVAEIDNAELVANGIGITVGEYGEGTLNLRNQAKASTNYLSIGAMAGATGLLSVDKSELTLNGSGGVEVGREGSGTLKVTNAGKLKTGNGQIDIGAIETGVGLLIVDGPESTLENTGYMLVGGQGEGVFEVSNGGSATTNHAYIGSTSQATGQVTISAGKWALSGNLTVGVSGVGALNVREGGIVTSQTEGTLGDSSDGIGTATIDGAGSSWKSAGTLYIGNYGQGRLDIANGGAVEFGQAYIGWLSGSIGQTLVDGVGSSWKIGNVLIVGNAGTGTLEIRNGGYVEADFVDIWTTGSSINIDGDGSLLKAKQAIAVGLGENNSGVLNISNGGELSAGISYIGSNQGAGIATISDAGSEWSNESNLFIGHEGNGILNMLRGGSVTAQTVNIGDLANVSGDALVDGEGSLLDVDLGLNVGSRGQGTLDIRNSGDVTSAYAALGGEAQAQGKVSIDGIGSRWHVGETIDIGRSGTGTLDVKNGATFEVLDSRIGMEAGSTGSANIEGDGSEWYQNGVLTVGYNGNGSLSVRNGGSLGILFGTYLAREHGSSGTLLVDGAQSSATFDKFLKIAVSGDGALSVINGGKVDAENVSLNGGPEANGTILVDGTGSVFNTNTLLTGAQGNGVITLSNGGTLNAESISLAGGTVGASILSIGGKYDQPAAAAGILNVSQLELSPGSNSLVFNHTGNVDGSDVIFASRITGQGDGDGAVYQIGPGRTILTGASDYTGLTWVRGGELRVDGTLGDTRVLVNSADGRSALTGKGSIGGMVDVQKGGVLAGTQGETLTMGELRLNQDATVSASLGTIGNAPALFDVTGDITLDGTLDVNDLGGFGAGIYRLFDYGGALTDNGLEIGAAPSGVPTSDLLVQTSVGQQVNLVSLGGQSLSFWDGGDIALHNNGAIDGGAGTWAQDSDNWTTANGAVNGDARPQPVFAIFQGEGDRVAVDASGGAVQASGMQFAADGYRIEGDSLNLAGAENVFRVGDGTAAGASYTATIEASLAGSGGLAKTDLGTLVLTGANGYTGDTRIDAGVLEVSSDANLGDASGRLILNGGSLRTTAAFESARHVALADAGTFDLGDDPLTLSGTIDGTGRLIKQGSAALVLTADNNYTGGTVINSGALSIGNGGATGSIVGDIVNNGAVIFDRSNAYAYGGRISGQGGVAVIAPDGLTLTGDSAYTGGTQILRGTLQLGDGGSTGAIVGDVVNEGTLALNRDNNLVLDGAITGSGAVRQIGNGTTVLGGQNGYTGATDIASGTLRVNGSIASSSLTTVAAGAALAGTGTVGNTVVDGTLAPGNSIGTLTVQGNLTQTAGSIYAVEVGAANSSDQVRVSGQATIANGAALRLLGQASAGSHYTVLTADGGLTGTYRLEGGGALSRFLSMSAAYDATHAYVNIEQVRDFAAAANTRNQAATAGGLDSLSNDSALHRAIANLADDAAARDAFDQMSGEAHASARGALLEESRYVREAASERARAASEDLAPASWGQLYGAWGRARSDGNAAEADIDRSGLLLGHEVNLGGARYGVLAGTARNRLEIDGRKSKADSDGWHLGAYAGFGQGAWRFDGGLAYSRYELESERQVRAAGIDEKLRANYDVSTVQAFAEAGYGIDKGSVRYEPFIGIAHLAARSGAFSERGGQTALRGEAEDSRATLATVGVRADGEVGKGGARFHGGVAWRHAFGDETPTANLAFTGGQAFAVAGTPIARDAALLEAGIDWQLGRRTRLSLDYHGLWADEIREHGAKAQLEVRF